MSVSHQILARLKGTTPVVAVTYEQFKEWPSAKRRQYLKDHPNSKFQEGGKQPTSRTRDPATNRLKRTVSRGKDPSQAHPGGAKYHFTDTTGKTHTYGDHKEVADHHRAASKRLDSLDRQIDRIENAHKDGKPMSPAVHGWHQNLLKEYHHWHDVEDTLGKLQRNPTYKKEMLAKPAVKAPVKKAAKPAAKTPAKPAAKKPAAKPKGKLPTSVNDPAWLGR